MPSLALILGDQLFEDISVFAQHSHILMVESRELCTRYRFHKQKLAFVLTSMRDYRDKLINTLGSDKVYYFTLHDNTSIEAQLKKLSSLFSHLQYREITEKSYARHIEDIAHTYFKHVEILPNPMFLTPKADAQQYIKSRHGHRLVMADFYSYQRTQHTLLVNDNGTPYGGRWSFDTFNRKKLPTSVTLPSRTTEFISPNRLDVENDIQTYFPDHPGSVHIRWLATTHTEAADRLHFFLTHCLFYFGAYEDALTTRDPYVFHSVLSPYLNNGLLTPQQVLHALAAYLNTFDSDQLPEFDASCDQVDRTKHPYLPTWSYFIPLSSVEGYIRQLIGWREWMKVLYDHVYSENLTSYNYFTAHNAINPIFYFDGLDSTDNIPLQISLRRTRDYGWNHHIERLMIFANYFTLTETDPLQAFKWFMEMFVDAYEWVMIPNVFGMGLFADGGIFATKPYIAGGNYIRKMSDYPRGNWERQWTNLFWNFVQKHQNTFEHNPRLSWMLNKRKNK